ncbi:MAG: anti-sigma factor domain-containing protein [Chloroflexota bacterium]
MQHETAQEQLAAYALNALLEAERPALEDHLRTCDECRRDLRPILQVVAVLPLAVEPVAPPLTLRRRILAVVAAEAAKRRSQRPASARLWMRPVIAWTAAAVLFVLVVGLGGWDLHEYQQHYAIGPLALTATTEGGAAQGVLFLEPGRVSRLHITNLPPLPADTVYEVWVIRDGLPGRAGIFATSESGTGGVELTAAPQAGDIVAVTRELAPGGPTPHGPVLLKCTVVA